MVMYIANYKKILPSHKEVFVKKLAQDNSIDYIELENQYLFADSILNMLNIPHPKFNSINKISREVYMDNIGLPNMADIINNGNAEKLKNLAISKLFIYLSKFYELPRPKKNKEIDINLAFNLDFSLEILEKINSFGQVIQHNDINASNILYDTKREELFLVDYSELGISYVGRDFISLLIDPKLIFSLNEIVLLINKIKEFIPIEIIKPIILLESIRKYRNLTTLSGIKGNEYLDLARITKEQGIAALKSIDAESEIERLSKER